MAVETLETLIRRAQQKDASAFDAVVEIYAPRLYGFLFRLTGHREDAEDLVQEVFVRLVRMFGQYRHEDRFEPWLFRIASNLARDRFRRIRRTPPIASLGGNEEIQTADEGPARRAKGEDEGEDRERLQAGIDRLPDGEREVILLRHYGELSFAEIAELMDTPLGTALARGHRGLSKLRAWMERKP